VGVVGMVGRMGLVSGVAWMTGVLVVFGGRLLLLVMKIRSCGHICRHVDGHSRGCCVETARQRS